MGVDVIYPEVGVEGGCVQWVEAAQQERLKSSTSFEQILEYLIGVSLKAESLLRRQAETGSLFVCGESRVVIRKILS